MPEAVTSPATTTTAPADSTTSAGAIAQTQSAMSDAIATNAAITALTIQFQVAMQGINATREAATEAYKKAGEANHSMHQ
jgi:hypothetical protein